MTNYDAMTELLGKLYGKDRVIRGCHIGLFQGDMEVRLLDEFPGLKVVGIDPLGAYTTKHTFPDGKSYPMFVSICLKSLQARPDLWNRFTFIKEPSDAADLMMPAIINHRPENQFDYVYIDGDHRYEQVRRDILNYAKFVKDDGWMIGDDYRDVSYYKEITVNTLGPEVKRAVDEIFPENLNIEVPSGTWWAKKKDMNDTKKERLNKDSKW